MNIDIRIFRIFQLKIASIVVFELVDYITILNQYSIMVNYKYKNETYRCQIKMKFTVYFR